MKESKAIPIPDVFVILVVISQAILYKEQLPLLSSFLYFAQFVCFLYASFVFITKRLRLNMYHWMWLVYLSILTYISISHNMPYLGNIFIPAIGAATLLMIVHIECSHDVDVFLNIFSRVFFFFVFLNFILIILFPNGIWVDPNELKLDLDGEEIGRYLIGGNRNQMGGTLLVASIVSAVHYYKTHCGFAMMLFTIVLSLLSVLINGSKTSLLGFSLLVIFLLINRKNSKFKHKFLLLIIIFYFMLQPFLLLSSTGIFQNEAITYLVEDVLHKDMTFSGRAVIWESSILMIIQSPLLGYGWQDVDWNEFYINGVFAHNFILHVLLRGGGILLLCTIIIITMSIRQSVKNDSVPAFIAHAGFWIFLFMMSTEVYNILMIVLIITLLYSSRYFVMDITKWKNRECISCDKK